MAKECVLILDNIRSVENVGSIFRTADGFGVSKVVLIGTTPAPVDRFGRKRTDFIKVSLGAEEYMKWEQSSGIVSVLNSLKNEGYSIIALEQDKRSINIKEFNSPNKFALILGSEVDGVSREALDLSDSIVEIGMAGMKESLNVSVAAGVALFHLLK